MDGIHIVAFAEEADPGEGGTQDWGVGVDRGTGAGHRLFIHKMWGVLFVLAVPAACGKSRARD